MNLNYEFCDDFFFDVRCCNHTNYQICPLSVNDMRIKCVITNCQLIFIFNEKIKKKYDIRLVDRIRNSGAHRITIHIDSWELFFYHHSFINCSTIYLSNSDISSWYRIQNLMENHQLRFAYWCVCVCLTPSGLKIEIRWSPGSFDTISNSKVQFRWANTLFHR